jgi:hypothetical protein
MVDQKGAVVTVVMYNFVLYTSRRLAEWQAMQHVSDLWCATIGSTTITVVNSVYEYSKDDFPTDGDCQEFSEQQLDDLEYLYRDTDSKVQTVCILDCQLLTHPQSSHSAISFEGLSSSTHSQHITALFKALSRFPLWVNWMTSLT